MSKKILAVSRAESEELIVFSFSDLCGDEFLVEQSPPNQDTLNMYNDLDVIRPTRPISRPSSLEMKLRSERIFRIMKEAYPERFQQIEPKSAPEIIDHRSEASTILNQMEENQRLGGRNASGCMCLLFLMMGAIVLACVFLTLKNTSR